MKTYRLYRWALSVIFLGYLAMSFGPSFIGVRGEVFPFAKWTMFSEIDLIVDNLKISVLPSDISYFELIKRSYEPLQRWKSDQQEEELLIRFSIGKDTP